MILASKKTVLYFAVLIFPSILSSQACSSVNESPSAERRNDLSKSVNWGDNVLITTGPREQPHEENGIDEISRLTGGAILICKEADATYPLPLNS